jgi:hypothetical protein
MAAFAEEEAIVRQSLGFKPKEFLKDVSSMVESTLASAIETYKRELLAIANSKGYDNITDSVIDDSCQDLLRIMQDVYGKNMAKFDLYAERNIFSLPAPGESLSAIASKQALEKTTSELNAVRQKYLETQAQNNRLKLECEEAELLLKDMRSAMFNLKVGSQVLDEYSTGPFQSTMVGLGDKKVELHALYERAASLVQVMEKASGAVDSESATSSATGIESGSAFDTGKVNEAMRPPR